MPASSRPDAIITANAGASAPVLANGAPAPVTAPVTEAPGAAVTRSRALATTSDCAFNATSVCVPGDVLAGTRKVPVNAPLAPAVRVPSA